MAETIAVDHETAATRSSALRILAFAYLGLLGLILVAVAAVAVLGRARDGRPVAVADVTPVQHAAAKLSPRIKVTKEAPRAATPESSPPESAAPALLAAPPPEPAPVHITKSLYAGAALVADPDLIEETAAGPLPRIGDDGRKPMSAYAPPVAGGKGPRIAIVIGGLGISAKATAAAIADLPAAVTLSFPPYAGDVQRWVNLARARGHEVLIEVPMEPYDFPDSDPGPHTLRTGAPEDANIERLTWALTRFSGYAGITNLLGGRFLADTDSLEPVMSFVARRGLIFFDSSSGSRSAASDVASQANVPFAKSATAIDTIQTGMEIDQRLSELETRARASGSAAGAGFIYPVTVDRVKVWAKGLSGRGFVLVPASAIVTQPK